jgi:hypothetical protein
MRFVWQLCSCNICCYAAAPGVFNYTSRINNSTYMLNTNPMAYQGAESFCNDYGGHLVSYGSGAEQVGWALGMHWLRGAC